MHATDLDLTGKDIGELTSPDAFSAFLAKLGYQTTARAQLTPESIGLAGDAAAAFKKIELLSADDEQLLRVVFAQPRPLTAKARNDLARVLGKSTIDHLLILASDYEDLEFVLLDQRGPPHAVPARPADAAALHLDPPGRPRPVRQAPQRLRHRPVRRRLFPEPGPVFRLLPAGAAAG